MSNHNEANEETPDLPTVVRDVARGLLELAEQLERTPALNVAAIGALLDLRDQLTAQLQALGALPEPPKRNEPVPVYVDPSRPAVREIDLVAWIHEPLDAPHLDDLLQPVESLVRDARAFGITPENSERLRNTVFAADGGTLADAAESRDVSAAKLIDWFGQRAAEEQADDPAFDPMAAVEALGTLHGTRAHVLAEWFDKQLRTPRLGPLGQLARFQAALDTPLGKPLDADEVGRNKQAIKANLRRRRRKSAK